MEIENTGERRAIQRRVHEIIGEFIVRHLWKIIIGVLAFLSGGGVTYLAVGAQVSAANKAATNAQVVVNALSVTVDELSTTMSELRGTVEKLATRDQLDDAKERIDRLEDRMDYAKEQAGTSPYARRRK